MTNNGRSSLEVEPESLLSLYSPGESRAAQRQALADDGTGGLTGLFKQYLEIAQSFRVALRQLCGDLVLRGQEVFQNPASVCIPDPIVRRPVIGAVLHMDPGPPRVRLTMQGCCAEC